MSRKTKKKEAQATLNDVLKELKNITTKLTSELQKAASSGIHSGMKSGAILGANEVEKALIAASKVFEESLEKINIGDDLGKKLKKALHELKGAVGKEEFKGMKQSYVDFATELQDAAQKAKELAKTVDETALANANLAGIAAANVMAASIDEANLKAIALKKNIEIIKDGFAGILLPLDKMIEKLNKIPIIGKILGKMVTEARDEMAKKLSSSLMKGMVDGVINFAKAWPMVTIAIALVVLLLAAIIGKFIAVQKAVQKVADETGVVNGALIQVQTQMVSAVRTLGVYGVTLEVAGQAWASIYKIQGVTGLESQKLVNTTALMVSNLGMTADDAANALITFRAMGNATDEQAASMVGVVANTAKLAGMSPAKIIGDMAKNSKFLMTYMRDSGVEAAKLAIQSNRMGISLETAGRSTSELLEWETSIEDEMNATVMLGRELNLQKVRALMFDGKIAEAQKELRRIYEYNLLPAENIRIIPFVGVAT